MEIMYNFIQSAAYFSFLYVGHYVCNIVVNTLQSTAIYWFIAKYFIYCRIFNLIILRVGGYGDSITRGSHAWYGLVIS